MSTATVNLIHLASEWRSARHIYPIYAALNRKLDLGAPPCGDLESPIDRSEPEVMVRIQDWFGRLDPKIEVHQLRQLLQSTRIASEENLRALLQRHLSAMKKDNVLRDKVDYLMVQYYAHCAPSHGDEQMVDHKHVAKALHPVLGDVSPLVPDFCNGLNSILEGLDQCSSLKDLLERKIIDHARSMKNDAGERYFLPPVLVAYARFNFLLRRGFFRLMHADLHAVRLVLHDMESQGRDSCDCTAAGLSPNESFAEIRRICHDWKTPYRAAYSLGHTFAQIVNIRNAVELAARQAPAAPKLKLVKPAEVREAVLVPVVAAEPTPPAPIAAANDEVGDCARAILEHLTSIGAAAAAVSNIVFHGTKLVLATWEVAAFLRPQADVALHLQRSVAARTLVKIAAESKHRGEQVDMPAKISAARAELPQIQALIATAKQKKDIDTAVNLAATSKRLLAQIEQAGATK